VHGPVLVDNSLVHGAGESGQSPVHDAVSPVGSASSSNTLRTTAAANPAKSGADELLGVGHEQRRLADLAHGACDQVRLNELDLDTLGFQFGAESGRPLLQESLATAVSREVGRGEDAAERCHGQDETALTLHHAGSDKVGHAKGSHAVDCDNVAHFLRGSLVEGNGDAVAQPDVIDQNGDVESRNQALEVVIVLVRVCGEVHGDGSGLDIVLALDFRGESIELALCAGDEEDVVTLLCELEGVLFAESIRGASDESPCTLLAKLGELIRG